MSVGINLDSFFSKVTTDNNGVTCCDINEGLYELFESFNYYELNMHEEQRYLVANFEAGYSDSVAKNSILGSQEFWWWILLMNHLEDPLVDIKENWIYSINSKEQVSELLAKMNENSYITTNKNNDLGKVINIG